MEGLTERITAFLADHNNPVGLAVLALSALVEYVFPPFPGDTVTLFGAFLITAKGWSFTAVFLATVIGSTAGAMLDFSIGRWFARREEHWTTGRRARARVVIDRLVEKFRRHGEAYIAINRFLPGVRAFFFVAAGMARLRPGRVALFAALSAAAWNLVLIAAGAAVGARLERIYAFGAAWARAAWTVLGLALVVLLALWLVQRRRRRRSG